jgi:hypothetical protein
MTNLKMQHTGKEDDLIKKRNEIMKEMEEIKNAAWQMEKLEMEKIVNEIGEMSKICCFDFDEVKKILAFGMESGLVSLFLVKHFFYTIIFFDKTCFNDKAGNY